MLEKYYSETAWSAFYAERVNNIGYINAFGNKYKKLINFIDSCLNMYPGLIVKEEGCGIGNVSKSHYLFGKNKAKHYLLTDIDNVMLMLAYKNLEGVSNKTFVNENILDECVYEKDTLVITHGVLEHFSDENIAKIIARYNNDHVKFHGHYVPLDGYLKPSFGDERLLSAMDWIHKVNPSAIEMTNNEDLFMYF